MKRPSVFYSIWAVFNNTQQKLLENLKKKINKELKGPFFPVHMTISAGFLGEEEKLINKMQLTLKKLDKFNIELEKYDYTYRRFVEYQIEELEEENEELRRRDTEEFRRMVDGGESENT